MAECACTDVALGAECSERKRNDSVCKLVHEADENSVTIRRSIAIIVQTLKEHQSLPIGNDAGAVDASLWGKRYVMARWPVRLLTSLHRHKRCVAHQ